MKRFTGLLVFLLLMGNAFLIAQETVSGIVTSAEDDEPIPGVSVVVTETNIGTITNVRGEYSIKVPSDTVSLKFSFVGLEPQVIPVDGQTKIDVTMETASIGVNEVVVTAMGISRDRKSIGYAIQEVEGEKLDKQKKTNLINAISGKVAGVQVKNNTNFGGSSNIVIRGSSSIEGSNQALFIVDGVPISNKNYNNVYQAEGRSGYDYGNPLSDINTSDIKNISVLKGSAATALYGSRAANGVILIETKKGEKNELQVNLDFTSTFHTIDESTFPEHQTQYGAGYGPYYSATDYPGLLHYDLDGDGERDYVIPTTEDASRGSEFDPELMVFQYDAFFPESPTYLQKSPYVAGEHGAEEFFKTGQTYTTSAEVLGGSDVSTFRLAYSNTTATGIMPNSEMDKHNVTLNGSYDLTEDLTVSAQAIYNNTYTKGRNHTGYSDNLMSMFRQWYNVGVDIQQQKDLYFQTGENITWNPNSDSNLNPIYWDNPYWQRHENYQDDTRDRIVGYTKIDYQITDELSVNAQYSIDGYSFLQEERKAVGSVSGEFGVDIPDVRSGYLQNDIEFRETNFDAMVKYRKVFGEVDVNAFVGSNMRRVKYKRVYASTNGGLAVPESYALSNSASSMLPPVEVNQREGIDGLFGNLSLGFMNMFYLDGSYRQDWSSTLPSDNRSYGYYSTSGSFVFSELLTIPWLNNGKLRANYAQVGNDAPWGVTKDSYRVVAPFGNNTLVRNDLYKSNPDIKPEISGTLEGGLVLNMFDYRINLDAAVYQTTTTDQITPLPVSEATGYSYKYVNIGEIENKGLELTLNLVPVKSTNFEWSMDINWAKNVNEVVELGMGIENYQIADLQGGVSINAREGEPLGTIQGTGYVRSPDGRKVVDEDGYYEQTATSDIVLGNIQPDFTGGVLNSFSYKRWSASFLVDVQSGGEIFSLDMWYGMGTGLYPETVGNNDLGNPKRDPIEQNEDGSYAENSGGILQEGVVGIDENDDGEIDRYEENTTRIPGNDYGADGWATNANERYVYDASYVKLREVAISYDIPKNIFGDTFIKGATLSLIGSNLWIIHKNLPYADPEASQGSGNIQGWQSGVMPATRDYGFNIKLMF